MSNHHILIVDDDPQVRRMLRRCLEDEGYTVTEAGNGEQAETALGKADLVTLDLNLGREDGLEVARRIRHLSEVPIIMITGKGDMIDRIVGLEVGADDYIAKPFHLREVLARVRSVLRRSGGKSGAPNQPSTTTIRFDGLELNPSRRSLKDPDGKDIPLTTGEFDLLMVFVAHAHAVLDRDRIMDLLKGHDWAPNDRSIDNQVARLRKLIEADTRQPRLIKTVRGSGYSFTPVRLER